MQLGDGGGAGGGEGGGAGSGEGGGEGGGAGGGEGGGTEDSGLAGDISHRSKLKTKQWSLQ